MEDEDDDEDEEEHLPRSGVMLAGEGSVDFAFPGRQDMAQRQEDAEADGHLQRAPGWPLRTKAFTPSLETVLADGDRRLAVVLIPEDAAHAQAAREFVARIDDGTAALAAGRYALTIRVAH